LKKFLQQHDGHQGGSDNSSPDSGGADSGGADHGGADHGAPGESGSEDDGAATQPESLGSGFILTDDGYILTNQHVVADSQQVIVRLSDGREMPATIVGSDERSDLALLKIDARGLPAVKMADMSKLRVGEWVMAIGSPFGFDYSATAGIVSAKGRTLDTEQYVPFIQTDTAINPGNSGGPLFNLRGEVVGVNSQIYSQTGGFMGVAFAVPIDLAAKVARELREKGKVTRGWLGVVVQEVDRGLAKSFGLSRPRGALVARVLPGSPAGQAGLRPGDVILSYNDIELKSSKELPPLVGGGDPADTINLHVVRDGKNITIRVQLGMLENQDQADQGAGGKGLMPQPKAPPPGAPTAPPPPSQPSIGPLGLRVEGLNDAQRTEEKLVAGGVRVVEVGAGAGREAGVQMNDVVLAIAGQQVDSASRFAMAVSRLTPGQSVPILIQRRGGPLFLAVQVPAHP
jgi:serine protease Do